MVHALKDTLDRGSLGKVAVSAAAFQLLLPLLLIFSVTFAAAASNADPPAANGDQVKSAQPPKPASDPDDLKLDALEEKRDKPPYSLITLEKKGIRVTAISVRENSSGKIEKVESDNFPTAKFFGKLKIKGFGKNKVMLSDGEKTYDLSLEISKPAAVVPPPVTQTSESGAPAQKQDAIKVHLKRLTAYVKALSLEALIVHVGVLLLIFFLIIVLCVATFTKIRNLLSHADESDSEEVEEDFSDDYEPDDEAQELIAKRQDLKEKLGKYKIVDILVEDGKITAEQAQEALQKERETTRKAELILADEKKVTTQEVYEARARKYGMEFVDLAKFTEKEDNFISKRAMGVVPFKLANDSVIFPYQINRRRKILYFLHCSEPTTSLEDDIKRETGGFYSKFALADEVGLKKLILRMKNYFVLEEKFKLEDIMDPKKKKKIAEKKKSTEVKLTLAKLAFYVFATIGISALGFNAFVLNSPKTLLTTRVDECHNLVIKGDFSKVYEYLDSKSKQVFDNYTLPRQFGVSDSVPLVFSRVYDIEFNTEKTSASVKWVATRNRGGSPSRSEEVSRWIIENGKWVLDIASGVSGPGSK